MTRLRVVFLFAVLLVATTSLHADVVVTLLHFSDYHSHARPFFSEGRPAQAGVARAVRYLRHQRANPNTFVFSGGDMINKGAPAWSDRHGCVEWPWFNGIVDAMAYGNHDSDYGPEAFESCRSTIHYPILGANVFGPTGERLFDLDGKPYMLLQAGGARIGVFALAGSDFEQLVRAEQRPVRGARFADRLATARDVVHRLRDQERVAAVVLIGHAHREEDEALARAVPGIDLILGTHSHIKAPLARVAGTRTHYIAPFQYLTYVSRVQLSFRDGALQQVRGRLVAMDDARPEDHEMASKVAALQRELETDPRFAALFDVIGTVQRPLLLTDQLTKQTPLGGYVMEIVRKAADADLALSTTSSFRQALAPGTLTMEELRATLPYPNKILVFTLTGVELRKLLALAGSRRGTDAFAQISGVTAAAIDPTRRYRVATTDYLARVAPHYRDFFAGREFVDTGLEVRDEVRKAIAGP